MSEIELKVIFNDEINPVQNILEFNNQIIEFLKSFVEFKNKEELTDVFADPQKALYHIGLIMICTKLMKWYSVMGLAFASGEQDTMMELDILLKGFAEKITQKEEIKKNAN